MEVGSAPSFLTCEFLTECLRNEKGNQDIIIENYMSSPAVPPGENFNSSPFRVEIFFKTHAEDIDVHFTSIIIKSELPEGNMKDVSNTFIASETLFYTKFIPEANKLTNTQLTPKSLFSPNSAIVVLEDLKGKGFKMANKSKMLDFDHCRLYFTTAATLHAVSFAVHKSNPPFIESIGNEKVFSNDLASVSLLVHNLIRNGFNILSECTDKINDFKKYSKLIKDASPHIWDLLVEIHKPNPMLNTLTQGDPWPCNMMFKYDGVGKVCDIRLLDFQLVRYSSPVNDLIWFIWTSATHQVRRHRLNELYHVYVETFNNKLRELNCNERLTYEYVKSEERRLSPLAMYLMAIFPPLNSENSISNLEPFFTKENEDEEAQNIYRKYYDKYFCIHHLPKYLEQLDLVGVFDYLQQCNFSCE
uniref:CHK kinase-like domain-containing protein n=1 Tax=Homalodisca liturata TaxID=320908 RepID=A0A1B6JE89_9HEMI